jgi:DNA-binding transcriptional LysR family regulator
MSQIDPSQLDGRLLQLLLAVLEEGSITKAAQRLGVTQSAVSHMLDKLRELVGDPLFVKSGRGITATARAEALAVSARVLLEEMRRFLAGAELDAARLNTTFTIAANDLQRDLLLPPLLLRLRRQAPGLVLRVLASGVPTPELLRDGDCHLVISPRPPDASDIVQKRLFVDRFRVFYDAQVRLAPRDLHEYLDADHVTVAYEARRSLEVDRWLAEAGVARRFIAYVPGFAGIAPFLRATPRLATVPSLLRADLLRDLASCEVPIDCPPLPMFMIWHLRYRHDPLHRWVRQELEAVAQQAMAQVTGKP